MINSACLPGCDLFDERRSPGMGREARPSNCLPSAYLAEPHNCNKLSPRAAFQATLSVVPSSLEDQKWPGCAGWPAQTGRVRPQAAGAATFAAQKPPTPRARLIELGTPLPPPLALHFLFGFQPTNVPHKQPSKQDLIFPASMSTYRQLRKRAKRHLITRRE